MKLENTLKIGTLSTLYFFIIFVSYKHAAAEINYEKSLNLVQSGKILEALRAGNTAVNLNPKEPRYYYNLAKLELINENEKDKVYEHITTAISLNPKNLVTLRNVSAYFYLLALSDLNQSETEYKTYDPKYKDIAKSFFNELKVNYSTDLGVLVLVAKNEKRLGLTKEYQDTVKKIAILRQDTLNWHPELK